MRVGGFPRRVRGPNEARDSSFLGLRALFVQQKEPLSYFLGVEWIVNRFPFPRSKPGAEFGGGGSHFSAERNGSEFDADVRGDLVVVIPSFPPVVKSGIHESVPKAGEVKVERDSCTIGRTEMRNGV